jgi:branched-chain amino acid aminotransferase
MRRQLDSRTEFFVADAAFFFGTGVQVANIAKVDHRVVGNGEFNPVVKAIRDLYFDVVRGKVAKYKHWCAPVYAEEPATL